MIILACDRFCSTQTWQHKLFKSGDTNVISYDLNQCFQEEYEMLLLWRKIHISYLVNESS